MYQLRAQAKRYNKTSSDSNPDRFESAFRSLQRVEAKLARLDTQYVDKYSKEVRGDVVQGGTAGDSLLW